MGAPPSAVAAPTRAEAARARDNFIAAERSFERGKYEEAVALLDQSFALTHDPSYLFRAGRAAAKAVQASALPDDTKRRLTALAVQRFRQYLKEADRPDLDTATKAGPTREAASREALAELEKALPAADPEHPEAPADPPAPVARTGLVISSPTPNALIEVDGKTKATGYLTVDTEPGTRHVIVSAEGWKTVERDVPVERGAFLGLEIELRPEPALLTIAGPSGAELYVDGVARGELPLAKPLELDAGQRFVSLRRRGSEAHASWQTLARGQRSTLDAALPTTAQRYAAYTTFGVSAASAGVAAALTALSFDRQASAEARLDRLETLGNRPLSERDEIQALVSERDQLRLGAGIAWGASAAALGAGVFLFVFDLPPVPAPPVPPAAPQKRDDGARPETLSLHLGPGPGDVGLGVGGLF